MQGTQGSQAQSIAPTHKAKGWSVNRPTTWPIMKKLFPVHTPNNGASVQVFGVVGQIDKGLLFIFETISSLSVLLLAFGLITSQTNVQTHGLVLTANPGLQEIWAWSQNIAIDMSLLGAIIRACVYWLENEKLKALLYSLLSAMLLFTAAIVSNIEAITQSISGLSLQDAYGQVMFPVTVQQLTAIRSLAIVLILVAHAVQYVSWYHARYRAKKNVGQTSAPSATSADSQQTLLAALAEMNRQNLQAIDERFSRIGVSLVEEITASISLPAMAPLQQLSQPASSFKIKEEGTVNTGDVGAMSAPEKPVKPARNDNRHKEKIIELLTEQPTLTDKEIVEIVGCSLRTAWHWKKYMQPAK
jgi:hypothetical protein